MTQPAMIGYIRVSTQEQASNGNGLEAQERAIRAWAAGRCNITLIRDEGTSGKDLDRNGLRAALEMVANGEAAGIVAAKLDRLSRSVVDFAELMTRARDEGWILVALDLGVDTSTPEGEMMANILASFAQFERRLISQRTIEGLESARQRGVQLGRRSKVSAETETTILRLREGGDSLRDIAETLNGARVEPPGGGSRWYPSTIQTVLRRIGREAAS